MIWKTIPNFPNYEISEYGNVRRHISVAVVKVGHRKKPGQLLKPSANKYPTYSLVNESGEIVRKRLSHLLLSAFVGPQPKGMQALHWDDDQTNNYWKNLRWGTPKDNGNDKIRNGTAASGSINGAAKLSDWVVLSARQDYKNGMTLHQLVEKYRVTMTPMWAAVTGKSWKHLPGAVPRRGQGARTDLRGKY